MKPEDDPWLKNAHKNAELLERENEILTLLTIPIRKDIPIVTKYQDFWNQAKLITSLFKELKPLVACDRDLLWRQFNALCHEVKEKQKTGYRSLESTSRCHFDEIMKLVELARLPADVPVPEICELVRRGKALKNAGDMLGNFKHEIIAKHKKTCFDQIQKIRRTHDTAWGAVNKGMVQKSSETESRVRKNLEANYERHRKAAGALENFQIGRGHICTFLATCKNSDKSSRATAQLVETEARIKNIEEGIRKLEKWIADDERTLKKFKHSS